MLKFPPKIVAVMCTDENGADFMQVAIKSIFINNTDEDLELHILTDGLSARRTREISKLGDRFGRRIDIHTVDIAQLQDLPVGDGYRFPKSVCFRFLIPEILSCPKALYLDSDIIVESSLRDLWLTDMRGNPIAAVVNRAPSDRLDWHIYGRLPLTRATPYFNAGVLLMDLDRFRRDGISGKCLGFMRDNPELVFLADQDALNVVLKGQVTYLPLKYNIQFETVYADADGILRTDREYEEAMSDPVIIRFTTFKPWMFYGVPGFPVNKKRFTHYRRIAPSTTVRSRNVEYIWLRRAVQYALYRLHLYRIPTALKGIYGFDRDVRKISYDKQNQNNFNRIRHETRGGGNNR